MCSANFFENLIAQNFGLQMDCMEWITCFHCFDVEVRLILQVSHQSGIGYTFT